MAIPIEFPGVVQPVGLYAVRTLGVFPNQSLLWCLPQQTPIGAFGNLTFGNWNGTSAITFRNCVVDRPNYKISTSGHSVGLVILDRRAYWEFASVTGRYNVPAANGSLINQRSAQQLATLCFTALGETADVSALPADVYPQVNWDASSARLELARLLNRYGCDVSLRLDDSVAVVRLGVGAGAPANIDIQSLALSVDPKIIPQTMRLYCGPTLVQAKVRCVPVGIDNDGTIQKIDDLSYAPPRGWVGESDWDQFPGVADLNDRQLAVQTVGRLFAIETFEDETLVEPGLGVTLSDISQIFPVLEDRLDGSNPKLTGKHWIEGNPPVNQNSEEDAELDQSWTLDNPRGLIRTTKPVLFRNDDDLWECPTLVLECAYAVRRSDTLIHYRQEYTAALGGPFGEHVIRVPTLGRRIVTGESASDNEGDINTAALAILSVAVNRFTTDAAASAVYRAIQPINTDGANRQVTWSISTENGFESSVSVNTEALPYVSRAAERRLWQETRQALGPEELSELRESLQRVGLGRLL